MTHTIHHGDCLDVLRGHADFLDSEALTYGESPFSEGIKFSARRLRDLANDLEDAE